MANQGIIQAIASVFESRDERTLIVALEGMNFILKAGQDHPLSKEDGTNPMVTIAMHTGVVDQLEQLQMNHN